MRDEKYEGEGEGEERKEDYVDFGEAGDKENYMLMMKKSIMSTF